MEIEVTEVEALSYREQLQHTMDRLAGMAVEGQLEELPGEAKTEEKEVAEPAKTLRDSPAKETARAAKGGKKTVEQRPANGPPSAGVASKKASKTKQQSQTRGPFLRPILSRAPNKIEKPVNAQKQASPVEIPPELALQNKVADLTRKAKAGDKAAAQELSKTLDKHPFIWQWMGSLGRLAEQMLVDQVSAGDPLMAESLKRQAEALRNSLLGETPNQLIRMTVQRVVMTWLLVHYADTLSVGGNSPSASLARFQEVAERRFQLSLKSLDLARRMSAREDRLGAGGSESPPKAMEPANPAEQ